MGGHEPQCAPSFQPKLGRTRRLRRGPSDELISPPTRSSWTIIGPLPPGYRAVRLESVGDNRYLAVEALSRDDMASTSPDSFWTAHSRDRIGAQRTGPCRHDSHDAIRQDGTISPCPIWIGIKQRGSSRHHHQQYRCRTNCRSDHRFAVAETCLPAFAFFGDPVPWGMFKAVFLPICCRLPARSWPTIAGSPHDRPDCLPWCGSQFLSPLIHRFLRRHVIPVFLCVFILGT